MKLRRRGFTLIELLTVTSIISFLASTVLASVNNARSNALDIQRVASVDALRSALELYYSDHNSFPHITTSSSDPLSIITSADPEWQTLASYLVPKYIPQMPSLPVVWNENTSKQPAYVVAFSGPEVPAPMAWFLGTSQSITNVVCGYPYSYFIGVTFLNSNEPYANTYTGYSANDYSTHIDYLKWGGNIIQINGNSSSNCPSSYK